MDYPIVTETGISGFNLKAKGKVRDIYEIDSSTLLLVTTDRMSSFDVVLDDPIPGKGVILNQITLFWMNRFSRVIPNHILESDVDRYPVVLQPYAEQLRGRSVLVRQAAPLPVECIVRGYLAGSGWKSYQENGQVCGQALPPGLRESERLPEPLFTPSTKAAIGQHDENISYEQTEALLGKDLSAQIRAVSLALYTEAAAYAVGRGIIIADTKFEFGLVDGQLILIDEVLTPDSSRFWPSEGYEAGKGQPSFDKQYLRDWLESQPWDKNPPPPRLPEQVIATTARKYQDAYEILTGVALAIS